jgi:hypothetical protein
MSQRKSTPSVNDTMDQHRATSKSSHTRSQRRTLTIIDDDRDTPNRYKDPCKSSQRHRSGTPTDQRSARQSKHHSPQSPSCLWARNLDIDGSDLEVVDACDMDHIPAARSTRQDYRSQRSRSSSRSMSPPLIQKDRSTERTNVLSNHDDKRRQRTHTSHRSKHENYYEYSRSPVDKRSMRQSKYYRSKTRSATSDSSPSPDGRRRRSHRRKTWEVRRYNGKDDIEEYLVQFEITARYNNWTKDEMAMALLHALDGQARGVYNDLDDPASASYTQIKRALTKRFGLTSMTEVHEQALNRLKFAKGQNIRELAQQVAKLTKKAYPEMDGKQRERFAIKSLLQTMSDREAIFYIKDKAPDTLDQACTLFERYDALTGTDNRRSVTARTVSQPAEPTYSTAVSQDMRAVRNDMSLLRDQTERQFSRVADVLSQLTVKLNPDTKDHSNPASLSLNTDQTKSTSERQIVPRKPCPKCHQIGHWARDCPNQSGQNQQSNTSRTRSNIQCYECKETGHRWRDCPQLGNAPGPRSAPNTRSAEAELKQ